MTPRVSNIIEYLDDHKPQTRSIYNIDTIAVHRVGVDLVSGQVVGDGITAGSISRAFLDDPQVGKFTAMQTPYHFLIEKSGDIYQALAISDLGQHAAAWNGRAVGVALIGDFRVEALLVPQRDSLVWLLANLCATLGLEPTDAIRAHDRLENGTHTPGKVCPGGNVDIRTIIALATAKLRVLIDQRLLGSGLVA